MFDIFPWNPHLETGIALIDEQHRKLVALINRLAEQHVQGATEAEIQAILSELVDYAHYHFESEESIWQHNLSGNAWLDQHLQAHRHFFEHVVALQQDSRQFQAVLDDLFSYLTQWLASHILDNDKRMALALQGVNEGLSLEAAHQRADEQMRGATGVLIQSVLTMYQAVSAQALELMHEKLARQRAEQALLSSHDRWQFLRNGDAGQILLTGSALEQTLRTIIDTVPAGLVVADAETRRFVFANAWFCKMLGYSQDELMGMGPMDIHPAEVLPQIEADFQRMTAGDQKSALGIPVRRKDGGIFTVNIERVPVALGGRTNVLAIFTDITEQRNAALALEAERLRMKNAIDAAQAGTWEWDITADVVRFSERTAAMLGYPDLQHRQGLYGLFSSRIHPEDHPRQQIAMARHLEGELPSFELELRMRHKEGHWVWVRTLGRVMQRSADGKPLLVAGINIDITEQKTHREQIDYVALHDALTGLPNRKLFVSELARAMTELSPQHHLAVAYLDLDNFASINQTYGLEVGHQLIKEVGRRIGAILQGNQLLAHIGGDEFAVMCTHLAHPDDYVASVNHLLDVVAQPLQLLSLQPSVTASVGVALFGLADKLDAEQLLRQADQAMYLAKQAGKNRCHRFDPVKDESARERLTRIDEVRQALENNELVLYYQPKVRLKTGEVIGYEALIRWQHPQRGLLPPHAFIGLLEQHPMAITVGDWVINAALAQLAQWQTQGLETCVSVNIDAMQLLDPDFSDRLQAQLAVQPSVLHSQLELEILETGALGNMAHVSALIGQLQGLGLECSLDDFGTGYSSLTFLKQLAAHTLKIDQSFVRGMLDDAEHATIVNSVLGLARNFDRRALAEGVETEAHGRALIEFGCELGQGYAIARPMPAANVPGWLAQWRTPQSWLDSQTVGPRGVSVLLAEVEHRAWFKALKDFVSGQTLTRPTNASQADRFAQWLRKPGTRQRLAHLPGFEHLEALHQALHHHTDQLLARRAVQDGHGVSNELATLAAISDNMLDVLHKLRRVSSDSDGVNSAFTDL